MVEEVEPSIWAFRIWAISENEYIGITENVKLSALKHLSLRARDVPMERGNRFVNIYISTNEMFLLRISHF